MKSSTICFASFLSIVSSCGFGFNESNLLVDQNDRFMRLVYIDSQIYKAYASPRVTTHTSTSSDDNLPRHISNSVGEKTFIFSPRLKRWAAYDSDGYKVASGVGNGGADYCAELGRPCHTPAGTYRIRDKQGASCVSSKFPLGEGGAPMPYCMHFGAGFAIHGSPYVSERNGSHGCIRVQTPAAAWLSRYFVQPGTKVVVTDY